MPRSRAEARIEPVTMEGVKIIFRNFKGREGQYNREGDRNFAVILPDELARMMAEDGWNVKTLKPREDDEEPAETPYLPVAVNFKSGRPPMVVVLTSRGRNILSEDEVEMLDWADIRNVDLIVNPSQYVINGKAGIKAYLKSIYVTIHEDALELKYANLEDMPSRSGRIDE